MLGGVGLSKEQKTWVGGLLSFWLWLFIFLSRHHTPILVPNLHTFASEGLTQDEHVGQVTQATSDYAGF